MKFNDRLSDLNDHSKGICEEQFIEPNNTCENYMNTFPLLSWLNILLPKHFIYTMFLEIVRLSAPFPKSTLLRFRRLCGSELSIIVIP